MKYLLFSVTAALLITVSVSGAEDKADTNALAAQLRKLNGLVFPPGGDRAKQLPRMLSRSLHARLLESNRREAAAFEKVTTRAEWDRRLLNSARDGFLPG